MEAHACMFVQLRCIKDWDTCEHGIICAHGFIKPAGWIDIAMAGIRNA